MKPTSTPKPAPSQHRLPTVSAAQALDHFKSTSSRCISTGIGSLDSLLQNGPAMLPAAASASVGGVSKGKITEIFGPPGIGKTTLGMQITASALHAGGDVVWVDASDQLSGLNLARMLTSTGLNTFESAIDSTVPSSESPLKLLDHLTHFTTPTLAHLIALLCHPTSTFPSSRTSLIVIDSLSTLISNAYPKTWNSAPASKNSTSPHNSARKFAIIQYLSSSLQKLAATKNVAVVILSQCITKMRFGSRATLVPAINTTAWEQGLGSRVALFRDWGWDDGGEMVTDVRLAEIIKAEGSNLNNTKSELIGFGINEAGVYSIPLPIIVNPYRVQSSTHTPTPTVPQKRKLLTTEILIPDSEEEDDEDYGWSNDDDDDVPPPPPQWQGSEDILIKPPVETDSDDEDGDGTHKKIKRSANSIEVPDSDEDDHDISTAIQAYGSEAAVVHIGEIGDSEEEDDGGDDELTKDHEVFDPYSEDELAL